MGNLLDAPVKTPVESRSAVLGGKTPCAVSSLQGWRPYLEDEHFWVELFGTLGDDRSGGKNYGTRIDVPLLFGVLDGHGGNKAARFVKKFLPLMVQQKLQQKDQPLNKQVFVETLLEAHRDMDRAMLEYVGKDEHKAMAEYGNCGCTSAVAVVLPLPPINGGQQDDECCQQDSESICRKKQLLLFNLGDARAVVARVRVLTAPIDSINGSGPPPPPDVEILGATIDHTPNDAAEQARIRAAGGRVTQDISGVCHRVDGKLAVSRSFGDLQFRGSGVVCGEPGVVEVEVDSPHGEEDPGSAVKFPGSPGDHPVSRPPRSRRNRSTTQVWLLIGCDGIWEGFGTNEEAVRFVASVYNEVMMSNSSELPTEVDRSGQTEASLLLRVVELTLDRLCANEKPSGPEVVQPGLDNMTLMIVRL